MSYTLAEAIELTEKECLEWLDRSAAVPSVDKAAAQGDVSVLRVTTKGATKKMPKMVTVVASEASSNTHTLHPVGDGVFWEANVNASVTDLRLGTLTVAEGSQAFLSHQEHGALVIEPGTYTIGRQREFANEWAYVAD